MSRALYQGAEKRLGSMERVRQCGGPVRQCDGAAHNAIDADPRTFVLDLRTFVLDLRTPQAPRRTIAPSHHRTVAPYVPLISLEIASHSKIQQIGASVEATPAPVHAIVAGVSVDPACRRSTHWQGATQEDRIRAKVENKK